MAKHIIITHDVVDKAARVVAQHIKEDCQRDFSHTPLQLYAVPRGGVPAAYAVLRHLTLPVALVDSATKAEVIIDDLIDTGRTRERCQKENQAASFYSLFAKGSNDAWMVFPWEGNEQGSAEDIPLRLLQYIGEDPAREGLRETPRRFLQAWREWTSGYEKNVADVLTVFEDGAENYDEIVLVKNIPLFSHCEHHAAPFWGHAHIAYIPAAKILGLSKFARVVDIFARRLQVQERLTSQIAHALNNALRPQAMGVVLECRHMCLESRGVRAPGTITTTSCLLGAFKEVAEARAEFLRLVR